ncbi:gamma-glutamyl-gamma-aminobutyrate hydrolase family protein [Phytohabitans flavus]|uniref:gamma-glutamyl-gamma-aminobutyrate hydrolase family protein n=1 Tax=Phytohabitans flavus TaxID=1076124 RepID=UPI0031E517AB
MRPIIGITSYVEPATWGVWRDLPATVLPYSYVRAVEAAGGRAIVIPPDPESAEILRVLDGLVLAGGADIEPSRYGAAPHPRTDSRPQRDAGEFALVGADLPILGVCRGMQLLAVAYGGRLHQHLPDVVGHEKHCPVPGEFGSHGARFAPGSLVQRIMGGDGEVNSYHHQGVADAGRLTVSAWADDGGIEAVEDPARPFVLGVQWHPEVEGDVRPFKALVDASR